MITFTTTHATIFTALTSDPIEVPLAVFIAADEEYEHQHRLDIDEGFYYEEIARLALASA